MQQDFENINYKNQKIWKLCSIHKKACILGKELKLLKGRRLQIKLIRGYAIYNLSRKSRIPKKVKCEGHNLNNFGGSLEQKWCCSITNHEMSLRLKKHLYLQRRRTRSKTRKRQGETQGIEIRSQTILNQNSYSTSKSKQSFRENFLNSNPRW